MNKEYEEILDNQFATFDGSVTTLRKYLHKLLHTLWNEGEAFSGKRPFGDSGWDFEIYLGLIAYSDCYGDLDEYGHIDRVNEKEANKIVFELIKYIFFGDKG